MGERKANECWEACVRPAKFDKKFLITKGVCAMLYWAMVFFIVALVAAVLGFGGIAGTAVGIAKILFFVFLVLFIVSLIAGGVRRPLP